MDKFLFLCVIAISAVGCTKTDFSSSNSGSAPSAGAGEEYGGTDDVSGTVVQPGRSCAGFLSTTNMPIKALFSIDRSSSNFSTDPGRVYREASLRGFYDLYKSRSNFSWGLNGFDAGSWAFLNNGSINSPRITGSAAEMGGAIAEFLSTPEGEGTNYKAALQALNAQIRNDPSPSAAARYVIVFMSDGRPNDGYDNGPDGHLSDAGILMMLDDVRALLNLRPGQITLNAVYYGVRDDRAASIMQRMAAAGKGHFLDVNLQGKTFPIADIVTVAGQSCP